MIELVLTAQVRWGYLRCIVAAVVDVEKLVLEDESFPVAGGVLFVGVIGVEHDDVIVILLAPLV